MSNHGDIEPVVLCLRCDVPGCGETYRPQWVAPLHHVRQHDALVRLARAEGWRPAVDRGGEHADRLDLCPKHAWMAKNPLELLAKGVQ